MIPWPEAGWWRRAALILVAALVLLYVVYLVREIWIPLGLALMLATILDPVVDRMEARGWTRMWASAVIFVGFILALALTLFLLTPPIMDQASHIQVEFKKIFPDLSPQGLRRSFLSLGLPAPASDLAARSLSGVQGGFSRSTWVAEAGASVVGNLIWIVIIPIVAFWALKDFHLILGKGLLLVPHGRRQAVQTALTEVSTIFAKYLRGLALVSLLNGVATGLLLWAIRVPSALILGVIAGVLYAVPYIGAILTIVLTAGVAFVSGGWQHAALAVGTSVILHQVIFDQLISPRILGGQVGLHLILSIMALLAGNALLGILGMILAVPVAACIQIGVLSLVPKLRLAIDLGTSPTAAPGEPPATVGQIAQETKDAQLRVDATESLHQSVSEAVDHIEAAVADSDGSLRDRAAGTRQPGASRVTRLLYRFLSLDVAFMINSASGRAERLRKLGGSRRRRSRA